ncbi:MAG: hypothetical protein U1A77_03810 [Pirellulales bacterium]
MSLRQLWQKLLDRRPHSLHPQSSQALTGSPQARVRRPRPRRLFESLEQRRFMAADLGLSPDLDSVEPVYDTFVSDNSQFEVQDNSLAEDTNLQGQVPLPFWFNLDLSLAEPTQDPLGQAEKLGNPLDFAEPVENPLDEAEKSADPLDFAEPLEDPLDNAEKSEDPLEDAEPLEDPLNNAEQSQDPLENADPLDP